MEQTSKINGERFFSFVSEISEESVEKMSQNLKNIIKYNHDREEKERLFQNKVEELKNIFETKNLENLKGLKFDVEELTNLLQNEPEEDNTGITEGAKSA